MTQAARHADKLVPVSSVPVGGSGEGAVALPSRAELRPRLALPHVRIVVGPFAGRLALVMLLLGALLLVAFATAGPSVLVPRSDEVFTAWEAGPLHALFRGLPGDSDALYYGLSALIVGMLIAYGVAVAAARTLSARTIVIVVVALHAILLMSPPLQLNDVFNYLGYARLGALHHINPYTHVIAAEQHDPIYRMATWHHLHSPYGPLFTAATYLLPLGALGLSYWLLKVGTVLASLAFLALVWRCARQLGRDPRTVLLFVACNPIYLIYAVGGFHNDFFMLLPMMASIVLLTSRNEDSGRERLAGALLMLAVAIKFTAVLLLPFLLLAVWPSRERVRRVLEGAGLAAVPLLALSLALLGFSIPNLQDQSTLLTGFSIPNVVGLALGVGGATPVLLAVAKLGVVAVIVILLRRRGDWISSAGWATLALVASLGWLMPWYVIWVAPLAALGASVRLRRATAALTLFIVLTFVPVTSLYSDHGLTLLNTPAGHVSQQLQQKLK
jgi:alpha-1,6-mannosyltransferase